MRVVSTFDKHRMETNKSYQTYLRELQLQLGTSIASKHKIYLDTNYWVLLCNNALGKSNNPIISILSSLLHEGVKSQRIVCPMSTDIFQEILKQRDPVTLGCSVKLIDALSDSITLLVKRDRLRLELLHFFQTNIHGQESCHAIQLLVWTKLSYVLGHTTPGQTPFSPEEELVIQKAFLDQMWKISLSDMIETIGLEKVCQIPKMRDMSDELNIGKFAHTDENKSLKQMIMSEIAGLLDCIESELQDIAIYLYEQEFGKSPSKEEISASQQLQLFKNLLYHGFNLNRLTTELPGIKIPATLHAAIRWEVTRKYKPHDFHDIHHADAALPYFDIFLTENSLRCLSTRNDLALDKLYGCKVISKPDEAVAEIERLLLI